VNDVWRLVVVGVTLVLAVMTVIVVRRTTKIGLDEHRERRDRFRRGFEVKSTTGETPVPLKKENDHG